MSKKVEGAGLEFDEDGMDEVMTAKRQDTLRMEALDYSIANGLEAAQAKYPTIADFLTEWEGKTAKDYVRHEVTGGMKQLFKKR